MCRPEEEDALAESDSCPLVCPSAESLLVLLSMTWHGRTGEAEEQLGVSKK